MAAHSVQIFDVNGDYFEVTGIGYPDEDVSPLLIGHRHFRSNPNRFIISIPRPFKGVHDGTLLSLGRRSDSLTKSHWEARAMAISVNELCKKQEVSLLELADRTHLDLKRLAIHLPWSLDAFTGRAAKQLQRRSKRMRGRNRLGPPNTDPAHLWTRTRLICVAPVIRLLSVFIRKQMPR